MRTDWRDLVQENDALRAKLESLQRDLAARDATIAEMRERVKDYEDDYAAVVDEPCAPDEKHCTCVPILRRRIKELTAAEAKRFDLACAWRDTAEHIKAERDALRAKLAEAETAIKRHNDACQDQCGRGDQEAVACKYRPYFENNGRRCSTCPRYNMIDYPAAIAAGGDDAKD